MASEPHVSLPPNISTEHPGPPVQLGSCLLVHSGISHSHPPPSLPGLASTGNSLRWEEAPRPWSRSEQAWPENLGEGPEAPSDLPLPRRASSPVLTSPPEPISGWGPSPMKAAAYFRPCPLGQALERSTLKELSCPGSSARLRPLQQPPASPCSWVRRRAPLRRTSWEAGLVQVL